MKMLIAALALATLIAAPAMAAPYDRGDSAQSSQNGTYKGYPLRDWYRADSY
jgi:hypothetical protein